MHGPLTAGTVATARAWSAAAYGVATFLKVAALPNAMVHAR